MYITVEFNSTTVHELKSDNEMPELGGGAVHCHIVQMKLSISIRTQKNIRSLYGR